MNQTFSPTRFGRLLRKYFTDNRGQLLANLALLVASMAVMGLLLYYNKYPQSVDRNRPLLFFFIGGTAWYVFTWLQTEVLNQKERSITYLLQPASQFEKILLIWLVSGPGFLLVYSLLLTLMDSIGLSYVNHQQWTPEQQKIVGSYQLAPWYKSDEIVRSKLVVWVLTVLLHPFALAFTLWIRRFTLPLVAVLAFGLLILGMFLNATILANLTGSESANYVLPFSSFISYPPTGQSFYRTIELPQPLGNQIRWLVGSVAVTLLYIIAYFRLKEREV